MIKKSLILLTLTLGFSMPVYADVSFKLPTIPDCNIEQEECNEKYFQLWVDFKLIKEFYDKKIISVDVYNHYQNEINKIDMVIIDKFQRRFFENQNSYFVEVPECTYDNADCISTYQDFFIKFQEVVLLCNKGELDREKCLNYITRIQKQLTQEIDKKKTNN